MPYKTLQNVIAVAALALPFSLAAQSISDMQELSPEVRKAYMDSMSEDERRAKRVEWRAEREAMSDEDRAALREQMRARHDEMRGERDSMSDEERAARHEERRARHEQRRADWEGLSEDERRAKREERRSQRQARRAEWEGMTPEERQARMESMTPEERKAMHRRHRSGHLRRTDGRQSPEDDSSPE